MSSLKKRFLFSTIFIFIVLSLFSQTMVKGLPPNEAGALSQMEKSPRHGEWINYTTENNDKINRLDCLS